MKRFVDLRGSNVPGTFAWYDTVTDKFEIHSNVMSWDTFDEFAADYSGNDLQRYASLCLEWARKPSVNRNHAKIKLPCGTDIYISCKDSEDGEIVLEIAGGALSTTLELQRGHAEQLMRSLTKVVMNPTSEGDREG